MLQPLVVGLGRAGAGLHLRVLAQSRAAQQELFTSGPVIACDPRPDAVSRRPDVTTADSLESAVALVDPLSTVAHVCTPPVARIGVISELADHGITRFIVEKPLAAGRNELDAIDRIRRARGLDLVVVAHWLSAELTRRLAELVGGGDLGALRSISFAQHKPRFSRSTATAGHPTAFDVEIPHSLGVVLRLAGPAEVVESHCADMRIGARTVPGMGGARLVLRHRSGVVTEIRSDLTSPVQERRIRLDFERGSAIGHFPLSEHDDHAQLTIGTEHHVFRDDALTAFVTDAYRRFHVPGASAESDFALHLDAVRLICDAKDKAVQAREVPA
ncbi:hypothetical protein [Saccharopolyspora taberi]|uniref:Gfo/Idh/MocA-like oxidoreductase N-terminal domain-containing protein n=1 Tax=Saccharopolyspora taberi TaxID=60895 RepID=A0ABN3VEB4_9PSEU